MADVNLNLMTEAQWNENPVGGSYTVYKAAVEQGELASLLAGTKTEQTGLDSFTTSQATTNEDVSVKSAINNEDYDFGAEPTSTSDTTTPTVEQESGAESATEANLNQTSNEDYTFEKVTDDYIKKIVLHQNKVDPKSSLSEVEKMNLVIKEAKIFNNCTDEAWEQLGPERQKISTDKYKFYIICNDKSGIVPDELKTSIKKTVQTAADDLHVKITGGMYDAKGNNINFSGESFSERIARKAGIDNFKDWQQLTPDQRKKIAKTRNEEINPIIKENNWDLKNPEDLKAFIQYISSQCKTRVEAERIIQSYLDSRGHDQYTAYLKNRVLETDQEDDDGAAVDVVTVYNEGLQDAIYNGTYNETDAYAQQDILMSSKHKAARDKKLEGNAKINDKEIAYNLAEAAERTGPGKQAVLEYKNDLSRTDAARQLYEATITNNRKNYWQESEVEENWKQFTTGSKSKEEDDAVTDVALGLDKNRTIKYRQMTADLQATMSQNWDDKDRLDNATKNFGRLYNDNLDGLSKEEVIAFQKAMSDITQNYNKDIQADIFNITIHSQYDEVNQYAANNIYKLDSSAQTKAIEYAMDSGNQNIINSVVSQIQTIQSANKTEAPANSYANGIDTAKVNELANTYEDVIANVTQEDSQAVKEILTQINEPSAKNDGSSDPKKSDAKTLFNDVAKSIGQLNKLSAADRQKVIEYICLNYPSMITSLFKLYSGKDLMEMNLPGHIKNYVATIILRDPNRSNKLYVADYVLKHPTYFNKSIKDDVNLLYEDNSDIQKPNNETTEKTSYNPVKSGGSYSTDVLAQNKELQELQKLRRLNSNSFELKA